MSQKISVPPIIAHEAADSISIIETCRLHSSFNKIQLPIVTACKLVLPSGANYSSSAQSIIATSILRKADGFLFLFPFSASPELLSAHQVSFCRKEASLFVRGVCNAAKQCSPAGRLLRVIARIEGGIRRWSEFWKTLCVFHLIIEGASDIPEREIGPLYLVGSTRSASIPTESSLFWKDTKLHLPKSNFFLRLTG